MLKRSSENGQEFMKGCRPEERKRGCEDGEEGFFTIWKSLRE